MDTSSMYASMLDGADPDGLVAACLAGGDDPFLGDGAYVMDINDIIGHHPTPAASADTASEPMTPAVIVDGTVIKAEPPTTKVLNVSTNEVEIEFTEYQLAEPRPPPPSLPVDTVATSPMPKPNRRPLVRARRSRLWSSSSRKTMVDTSSKITNSSDGNDNEDDSDDDDDAVTAVAAAADDGDDDRRRPAATTDDTSDLEYVTDSSDGYNQSPDLEHIMSDHNYFNQASSDPSIGQSMHSATDDVGEPAAAVDADADQNAAPSYAIVDQRSPTSPPTLPPVSLTDLLLDVQHMLAAGSPVYDTCRDMLSLVTSLVLDESTLSNAAVLQTIVDQVNVLRGQNGDPPATTETAMQTEATDDAANEPMDDVQELGVGLCDALRSLQTFGSGVKQRNERLVAEVRDVAEPAQTRAAIAEYVQQMETEFAQRMETLRLAAGLDARLAIEAPTAAPVAQRTLSTECMEKLVYDTESEDDAEAEAATTTTTTTTAAASPSPRLVKAEEMVVDGPEASLSAPLPTNSELSRFIAEPLEFPPLNVFAGDDDDLVATAATASEPAIEPVLPGPAAEVSTVKSRSISPAADVADDRHDAADDADDHEHTTITATPAEEFEHFERSLAKLHDGYRLEDGNDNDDDDGNDEAMETTDGGKPTKVDEKMELDDDAVLAASGLNLTDGDDHEFVFEAVCEIDAMSPAAIAVGEAPATTTAAAAATPSTTTADADAEPSSVATTTAIDATGTAVRPEESRSSSPSASSFVGMMPVEVEMSASSDTEDGAPDQSAAGVAAALDPDEEEERDISRLLDFSSLSARKRPADGMYYAPAKKPDAAAAATAASKAPVETLMDDVANAAGQQQLLADAKAAAAVLSAAESDDDLKTEDDFLLERNALSRERMLAMSSSGSEDEDEAAVGALLNHDGDDDDEEEEEDGEDDDDENTTADDNSQDSAIEVFLQQTINEELMRSKEEGNAEAHVNGDADAKEDDVDDDVDRTGAPATPVNDLTEQGATDEEIVSPSFTNHVGKASKRTAASVAAAAAETNQPDGDDDGDEDDDTSSDEAAAARAFAAAAAAKKQRLVDKPIFGDLDKFLADGDALDATKPAFQLQLDSIEAVSDRSSLSSDCEMLDTSMFKSAAKSKQINDRKLSRIMRNSQRRNADANALAAAIASDAAKQATAAGTSSGAAAAATAASAAATVGGSLANDDCISLSSDTDLEELDEDVVEVPTGASASGEAGAGGDAAPSSSQQSSEKNRAPRKMLRADQLADDTKLAQTEEKERVKRLEKKAERLAQLEKNKGKDKKADAEADAEGRLPRLEESDVVLDYDSKNKCRITVHPDIVRHLKPHQVDGVKFMYDSCYGSVDDKWGGSGCILAHCMGLGKTLQLIALLHTLIRHPQLKTNKILVICPKSTVMNWAEEIERWVGPVRGGPSVKVYQFPDSSDINEKLTVLKQWQSSGKTGYTKAGCLLIGYEAFRTLVFYHRSKKRVDKVAKSQLEAIRRKVEETLLKPGADIVICDEGHMIKNRKSSTSLAVNEIRTRKRIILTGTPIQNNLKEYYSMVNFIKPSFLGTEKEFANLYANPIRVGQHKDSSKGEIKFMKQRSYVLHKKLSKFVQRREAALLKTFLPEKYEYVLFIPMTQVQNRLYVHFLENNPLKDKYGGKSLIPDYTFLRKIWTHPKVLESAYNNALMQQHKRELQLQHGGGRWGKAAAKAAAASAMASLQALQSKEAAAAAALASDSDAEQPDDVLDSHTGSMSVTSNWWQSFVTADDLESLLPSNKLRTLFEILQMCQETGDKCLVFSAFVAVLDVVEFFMKQINAHTESGGATAAAVGLERFRGPWVLTKDYYRLDGKTPKSIRHAMITRFNDVTNTRTRCFLISAKAGGQGINLIGANRVVLLDTSWNPSNDQQNIFRVFRLGQKNKCYIYRLLAMGTMEEKVYSRSVTKQAMSFRVVDEQQIDRHYSMAELAELYTLTIPDYAERPTPVRPYDNVLASLLRNFSELVYKYHEHDSLLERNSEQDLSEEEKADAWAAYEKDVSLKNQYNNMNHPNDGLFPSTSLFGGLNLPYGLNPFGLPTGYHPYGTGGMGGVMGGVMGGMGSGMGGVSNSFLEKDLMMISQMYNTPYANLLGGMAGNSSGRSAQSVGGPGQSGGGGGGVGAGGSPYLPYGSMPSTTGYGTNFGPSVASSAAAQQQQHQQNLLASLSSMMPSFGGVGGPGTNGPSTSLSSSSRPSAMDLDKGMWSYLNHSGMYGDEMAAALSSAMGTANGAAAAAGNSSLASAAAGGGGGGQQPGPNAMRNPLLYKELAGSGTTAEPTAVAAAAATGSPMPSIPTSVITSVGPAAQASNVPKDAQQAAQSTSTMATTTPRHPQIQQQQSSTRSPVYLTSTAAVSRQLQSAAAQSSSPIQRQQHQHLHTSSNTSSSSPSPSNPKAATTSSSTSLQSSTLPTIGGSIQPTALQPANKYLSRAQTSARRSPLPQTHTNNNSNNNQHPHLSTSTGTAGKSLSNANSNSPVAPTVISLGQHLATSNNGGGGARSSPEPHLIVKNVNAINQSIKAAQSSGASISSHLAAAATSSPSSTSAAARSTAPNKSAGQSQQQQQSAQSQQSIKNFNMGIVYPSAKLPPAASAASSAHKFDLNQNDSLLRAAHTQLSALGKQAQARSAAAATAAASAAAATSTATSPAMTVTSVSVPLNATVGSKGPPAAAAASVLSVRPIQRSAIGDKFHVPTAAVAAPSLSSSSAAAATTAGHRVVRRAVGQNPGPPGASGQQQQQVSSLKVTGNNSIQPLATNSVYSNNTAATTTSPAIKMKRWTNASGLTISPVQVPANSAAASTLSPQQRANLYTTAAHNAQRATGGTGLTATATGGKFAPQPMLRQQTAPQLAPTATAAAAARLTQTAASSPTATTHNNGTTIIRQTAAATSQQQTVRPLPPLVRQNTTPLHQQQQQTIRTTSGVSTSSGAPKLQQNLPITAPTTAVASAANMRPIVGNNRNVTVRKFANSVAPTTASTPTANIRLPAGATISPTATGIRPTPAATTATSRQNIALTSAGGSGGSGRLQVRNPMATMPPGRTSTGGEAPAGVRRVPQQQQQKSFSPAVNIQRTGTAAAGIRANATSAAAMAAGAPPVNVRMVGQQQQQQQPTATTVLQSAGGATAAATRKRKLPVGLEQMPSVSITEVKRSRLTAGHPVAAAPPPAASTTTATASRTVNQSNAPAVGSGANSFQEITILPRKLTSAAAAGAMATPVGGQQQQRVTAAAAPTRAKDQLNVRGAFKLD